MIHALRWLPAGALVALGISPALAQNPSDCSREALRGLVDRYFTALAAHDPAGLPLAPNVRSTENGVEVAVGKGLWQTAGRALLKRVLVDTQQCGVHASAVLEEPFHAAAVGPAGPFSGKKPLPAEGAVRPILFGVRLRVESGKITEIESILAREREFAFDADGVLATKDQDWERLLPPEERSSRLAMVAAADDYFGMFAAEPAVHTPFASPCDRWENGMFATGGGTALPGEDGKAAPMKAHDCSPKGLVISNHGPRRFLVDVEAGLVVAFVHFAGSLPDFHVFQMRNGRVERISAVVGSFSTSMGWAPAAAGAAVPPGDAALRVMSFNIRYDNPGDGEDRWANRKAKVASMIRVHGADVVGLQEAQPNQIADLQAALPQFRWFGSGRSVERDGEHCAVFYRSDRLEVLAESTFWLSQTPDVAGSRGWDAALPRIVTWAKLRDRRSGSIFHLFNTHLDHVGEGARRESARLLRRKVDEIAGPDGPAIVTGDFNATPDSEPYRILTSGDPKQGAFVDAMRAASHPHHGPTGSWNGFKAIEPGRRIDFVFVRPPIGVLQHAILSDTFDARFPSDHLPVLAEVATGGS